MRWVWSRLWSFQVPECRAGLPQRAWRSPISARADSPNARQPHQQSASSASQLRAPAVDEQPRELLATQREPVEFLLRHRREVGRVVDDVLTWDEVGGMILADGCDREHP